jgi:hypothetical protein
MKTKELAKTKLADIEIEISDLKGNLQIMLREKEQEDDPDKKYLIKKEIEKMRSRLTRLTAQGASIYEFINR